MSGPTASPWATRRIRTEQLPAGTGPSDDTDAAADDAGYTETDTGSAESTGTPWSGTAPRRHSDSATTRSHDTPANSSTDSNSTDSTSDSPGSTSTSHSTTGTPDSASTTSDSTTAAPESTSTATDPTTGLPKSATTSDSATAPPGSHPPTPDSSDLSTKSSGSAVGSTDGTLGSPAVAAPSPSATPLEAPAVSVKPHDSGSGAMVDPGTAPSTIADPALTGTGQPVVDTVGVPGAGTGITPGYDRAGRSGGQDSLLPAALMGGSALLSMLPMLASALAGLAGGAGNSASGNGGNTGGSAPAAGGAGSGAGGDGSAVANGSGLSPQAQQAIAALKALKDSYGDDTASSPDNGTLNGKTSTSSGSGSTTAAIKARQMYQRNVAGAFNTLDNSLAEYTTRLAGKHTVDKAAFGQLLRDVDAQLAQLGPHAFTSRGQQQVHKILAAALDRADKLVSGSNATSSAAAGEVTRLTVQYLNNLYGRQVSSGGSGGGGTTVGGTVGDWINQALQVLKGLGYNISTINPQAIAQIIQFESSGNPNAVNNSDSNAAAGHPSKGLMQTIQPTFDSYAAPGHTNILNPVDNIVAGVRYAISRYGSVDNVPGVRAVRNGRAYVGY